MRAVKNRFKQASAPVGGGTTALAASVGAS